MRMATRTVYCRTCLVVLFQTHFPDDKDLPPDRDECVQCVEPFRVLGEITVDIDEELLTP